MRTRRSALAAIAICMAASACQTYQPESRPTETQLDSPEFFAAVARAAGEELRRERGTFVVFPAFIDRTGEIAASSAPGGVGAQSALEAFRQGAAAGFADTSAYVDPVRRAALPDSARLFFTLTEPPTLRGDTATADVFGNAVPRTSGALEQTIYRYTFVRTGSAWRFLRRVLLYAA